MFEIEFISSFKAKNSKNLKTYRFLEIRNIVRNAHVMSAEDEENYFYVNSFVDFDHYNTMYDSDFLIKEKIVTDEFAVSKSLND